MPKRPVPRLGLMPQVNGSLKLQQDGGFAIAPVIAGATAAYEFAKKVKPATKLKGVLDGATEVQKEAPKACQCVREGPISWPIDWTWS
jgi:hypothetical protein